MFYGMFKVIYFKRKRVLKAEQFFFICQEITGAKLKDYKRDSDSGTLQTNGLISFYIHRRCKKL